MPALAENLGAMMTDPTPPLLNVVALTKYFPVGGRAVVGKKLIVRRVDDVSFETAHGGVLGLVGESGSGKSTVGRSVLRLRGRPWTDRGVLPVYWAA
jgi:ABC-type glutathione transport system ATPase component